jgi:acid phosphatase
VEFVEAFTIVLAMGVTRGWRSALAGASAAVLRGAHEMRKTLPTTQTWATTRAAFSLLVFLVVACPAGAAARGAGTPVPAVEKVVVVVFENKGPEIIGSGEAPTFDALAKRYALLTDYRGVAHPSLPNYLALVSGSTQGVTSDCTSCEVAATNLADTLERAQKTWKTYAEGLPVAGYTGSFAGRYAKKHDPLLYFEDVAARPDRLRRIVPLTQFAPDLSAHRLPDFSLVVPDLCHDMHDCPVSTGDGWLRGFLRPLLRSNELAHGIVYVLFDEGTGDAGGGGRVPALVLGPLVRPGARAPAQLDHYSLLRTVEEGWRLPRLGRSRTAPPISGIWR